MEYISTNLRGREHNSCWESDGIIILMSHSGATGPRVVWLVAALPHEAGHEEAHYKRSFNPAFERDCLRCHNMQGGQMGREYREDA